MGYTSKLMKHLSLVAAWVLSAALLLIVCVAGREPPKPASASMDGWSIAEMVARLREKGLELRLVPTGEGKETSHNAFLTTSNQGWKELNQLPKRCQDIERWRGTLYVEKCRTDEECFIRTELWGDCCLVTGPFIFFGDRSLLARIHHALDATVSPTLPSAA